LWLATNHKPEIRGSDLAVWRRIRLIPFTVTISPEEQDPDLPEKLRAELPGILRWAVEGCLAWQQEGLGLPDPVREATAAYRASMDVIGTFLTECCAEEPEAATRARDLYVAYVAWADQSKEHPESQRRFGEALAERGCTRGRDVLGRVVWRGITLRSEGSEGSEPLFR
jgi:putative DNA primase/helicase